MLIKISTGFAVSIIVVLGTFLFIMFYLYEKKLNQSDFQSLSSYKSSPVEILPNILRTEGRDTNGRALEIDEVKIDSLNFELADDDRKNLYKITSVKKYTLTMPVKTAVSATFLTSRIQRDNTYKDFEITVPDGKAVIGIKTIIENKRKDSSYILSPNFLVQSNDIKLAPAYDNFVAINGNAALEHEYFFFVDRGLEELSITYGLNPKEPDGTLLINFATKTYIAN